MPCRGEQLEVGSKQQPQQIGNENSYCVTGTRGMTRSTRRAAVCAMRHDSALDKRLELVFDERRHAAPGMRFDLGEKGLELFLHHLIQRRLLGPAPLVGEPRRQAHLGRL